MKEEKKTNLSNLINLFILGGVPMVLYQKFWTAASKCVQTLGVLLLHSILD